MWWLFFACTAGNETVDEIPMPSEPSAVLEEKKPQINVNNHQGNNHPKQIGPNTPNMKGGGQNGGQNGPQNVANGSGGAFQDPSGFPPFHDWKAPEGQAITKMGAWSKVVQLTKKPEGGYRPQVVVSKDDVIHVVYYERKDSGDIIHHRTSKDRTSWSDAVALGHSKERNWGPDIIARDDGTIVVVYDHALPDFRSRGFLTIYDSQKGSWSAPEALTPDDGGEIGSGHVAAGKGDELAYVFIGKQLGEKYRFQAKSRWFKDGQWLDIQSFSDGTEDAWHTNVERRPDGSVVAGFDIGTGGAATTLYFVEGKDGKFGALENITEHGKPGERPHFAFANHLDYVTWFHKEAGQPKYIYVRKHDRKTGNWSAVDEPSAGYGGFHFDPEIEINKDGVLCLVWGWDKGTDAEMVYAINKGDGWSEPKKIADIDWGKPGLASLSTDSQGRFHVVWNQGVRGYNEVYYSSLAVR